MMYHIQAAIKIPIQVMYTVPQNCKSISSSLDDLKLLANDIGCCNHAANAAYAKANAGEEKPFVPEISEIEKHEEDR